MHQCRLFYSSQFLFVFKLNFKAIQSDWKLSGQQTSEHLRRTKFAEFLIIWVHLFLNCETVSSLWVNKTQQNPLRALENEQKGEKRKNSKVQLIWSFCSLALFHDPQQHFTWVKWNSRWSFILFTILDFFLFFSLHQATTFPIKPTYNFQSSPKPVTVDIDHEWVKLRLIEMGKKVLNFI